jgi:hypothetical protein
MLGRKEYTTEELDQARAAVAGQLAAYQNLVKAISNAPQNAEIQPALAAFEPLFCDNMILALDRRFVHRFRAVTGKDGNPLNEVELLADSVMNNKGELRGNNVIKFVPGESVLGLNIGDRISLTAADFERLATAFLAEIDRKFVQA